MRVIRDMTSEDGELKLKNMRILFDQKEAEQFLTEHRNSNLSVNSITGEMLIRLQKQLEIIK